MIDATTPADRAVPRRIVRDLEQNVAVHDASITMPAAIGPGDRVELS